MLKGSESIAWCAADINKLPIKYDSFDGVICFGVTQALGSSETIIQGLAKTTKHGGQIWIDALNGRCLPHLWERFNRWFRKRPMHLRYESHQNLRHLLKSNNIVNIKLYWLPILPSRWNRFQWIVETRFAKWCLQTVPFLGQLFSHAFVLRGERAKYE